MKEVFSADWYLVDSKYSIMDIYIGLDEVTLKSKENLCAKRL